MLSWLPRLSSRLLGRWLPYGPGILSKQSSNLTRHLSEVHFAKNSRRPWPQLPVFGTHFEPEILSCANTCWRLVGQWSETSCHLAGKKVLLNFACILTTETCVFCATQFLSVCKIHDKEPMNLNANRKRACVRQAWFYNTSSLTLPYNSRLHHSFATCLLNFIIQHICTTAPLLLCNTFFQHSPPTWVCNTLLQPSSSTLLECFVSILQPFLHNAFLRPQFHEGNRKKMQKYKVGIRMFKKTKLFYIITTSCAGSVIFTCCSTRNKVVYGHWILWRKTPTSCLDRFQTDCIKPQPDSEIFPICPRILHSQVVPSAY